MLSIHVLNASKDDPDLLVLPELVLRSSELLQEIDRYFDLPTPGAENGVGTTQIGPHVAGVTKDLLVAEASPFKLQAQVTQTLEPVQTVTAYYRVMFGEELELPMSDDGLSPDAKAGDGVFSALVPAALAAPGEMLRWRVVAADAAGTTTRAPRYEDPLDSEEYYGGVVDAGSIPTSLPVFFWFVEEPAKAGTEAGTRTALFFDGELYDNVRADVHGQSTKGFPKKSYDLDFPKDHRFLLTAELPRMKDINLLTNWADKSKMRNTLAYEVYQQAGTAYHLAFPVRVHQNGEFFAVYDFVEDGDDRWLSRIGLDADGALYKMYDRLESVEKGEKKTRKDEDKADLQALIDGAQIGAGPAQDAFVYDALNVPGMVDFLAAMIVTGGHDCCHKNYYAYRDTLGTGQWWYLPWDVDLTFGRSWNKDDKYFDDTMHPDVGLFIGSNNKLVSMLFGRPEFLEMYLRRLRTLMDEQLQPPGTPPDWLIFEARADELLEELGEDAALDLAAWPTWGLVQSAAQATEIMKTEFFGPRRIFLYETMAAPAVVGEVLVSGAAWAATARWHVPDEAGATLPFYEPDFDDTSWTEGPMGVGFEATPGQYAALIGTEVVPHLEVEGATSVQIRILFDAAGTEGATDLTLRVKYDDGFVAFLNGVEIARRGLDGAGPVAWNTVSAVHPDAQAVLYEHIPIPDGAALLQADQNVLAIQVVNAGTASSDLLLAAELVAGEVTGGTGPIPGPQLAPVIDFGELEVAPDPSEAWVELTNPNAFAVDVSGWRLEGDVQFTLEPGTVLPAGGSLLLAADQVAFRAREEAPKGGLGLFVRGDFAGVLGAAPTLELRDAKGALVNSY